MIRTRWGRRVARVLPVVGLAGLAAAVHFATGNVGDFRHGLLIGVAVAAVFVVAPVAMEQRGLIARLLAMPPLVWLGTISYGVYLWHWPIFMALNGERTGWTGWPLFAARCGATLAVAAASYWLIEQPVRRWRPARVALLPLAAATVASAAAITLLVIPVGTGPGLREGLPPGVAAVAAVSPAQPGEVARWDRETPIGRSPFRSSVIPSAGRGCTSCRRRPGSPSWTTRSSVAAWFAAHRIGTSARR